MKGIKLYKDCNIHEKINGKSHLGYWWFNVCYHKELKGIGYFLDNHIECDKISLAKIYGRTYSKSLKNF